MKYIFFLLLPFLIYANEPTILEELTDEIGIEKMAQKLEIQKSQSDTNSKRIDDLSNRLKLMNEKMQDILNTLTNKNINDTKEHSTLVVNSPKEVINNSSKVIYTIQIYSSYDRDSAVKFFNKLPEFMRKEIKLYKIGSYYVLRYGSEEVRSNLSAVKNHIVELGYKDVFSVKTSISRFNSAEVL